MENAKCPYFLLSLVFAGLGVVHWLALIPFIGLLSVHVYSKHIKGVFIESDKLKLIYAKLDTLEKRISFK